MCGGEADAELCPRSGGPDWAPKGWILEHSLILLLLPDPVHGLPHWDAVQVKGTGGRGRATLGGELPLNTPLQRVFRERGGPGRQETLAWSPLLAHSVEQ